MITILNRVDEDFIKKYIYDIYKSVKCNKFIVEAYKKAYDFINSKLENNVEKTYGFDIDGYIEEAKRVQEIDKGIFRNIAYVVSMLPELLKEFKDFEIEDKDGYFEKAYENLRGRIIIKDYIKDKKLYMCPYCNMHDISVYKNNNNLEGNYDLDHFYNKKKYPVLALCIYNLVPTCHRCNIVKSESDMNISPYDEDIDFYNNIKFNIINNKIEITTTPDNEEDLKLLSINNRYNTEYSIVKDEIVELKNKVEKYGCENYFSTIGIDIDKVDYILWLKDMLKDGLRKEEEFYKYRLSKAKSDITKIGVDGKIYDRIK